MVDALFKRLEDGYRVSFVDQAMEFVVDRLRWDRHELFGQLSVSCGLDGAKTIDGSVSVGTFNLSSTRARRERAKEIRERIRANLDTVAMLEEVCQRILAAEREGEPAINLRNVQRPTADDEYNVDGFCFPKRHPTALFGDGDSLKSYLSLYVLGVLAKGGARVGFFDFELDAPPHRDRLERLFGSNMPDVLYVRCDRPLIYQIERLRKIVRDERIEYAAFDSVGFACPGPPEDAENALAYFRAVRQLHIGTAHIAHVRQTREGETEDPKRPFGSAFWHNSARATWFVKRAATSADGSRIAIGLYNRKANLTALRPAIGFEVIFEKDETHISPTPIADVAELAEGLPLWERMRQAVTHEPKTLARLADELNAKVGTLDKASRRKPELFTRVSGADGIARIALVRNDC